MPVPQTTTPLRCAAATSIATLAIPVVISSFSSGRRSRISAGQRGALAHRDDDLGLGQRLDQGVGFGEVLLERDELPLLGHAVPAAVVEGDALVVVEQDDPLHPPSLTHG